MVAAAFVNTASENTDACTAAMVVEFVIMASGRTDVLSVIISLAPSRDARSMVTNTPVWIV